MAKPPEIIQDRFRIVCEVDEQTMGSVVGQLTRMGLQGIGYELISDIKAWGRNGARVTHPTSAQEAVIAYMEDHPAFQTDEIVAHFKAEGRTSTSCYGALKTLLGKKKIAKPRPGNYQRIDGLLAPPAAAAEETSPKGFHPGEDPTHKAPATGKKQRGGATPRYEVGNKALILAHIKTHKTFTVKEIQELLQQQGRNAASASPVLSVFMNKDKLIEMIEPGKYRRITKGAANG